MRVLFLEDGWYVTDDDGEERIGPFVDKQTALEHWYEERIFL